MLLLVVVALVAVAAAMLAGLIPVGSARADDAITDTTSVIPAGREKAPAPDPDLAKMFSDKKNCLSCHGDQSLEGLMTIKRPDGSPIVLYVDRTALANTVHRYKDCTSCHGDDPHDNKSALNKMSLSAKCGTCHDYEYAQYKDSVHGQVQSDKNSDAATCTDCHSSTGSPHNIQRVLDPDASAFPKNVAQTCSKCHDNPELMGKYGIVEKVYDSYMRTFHGKAINLSGQSAALQQLNTATCVNCHGSHNISAVNDPKSSVGGMDNLLKTCQSCHPTAGPEFVAGFTGHKAVNSEYMPKVYWGGKLFYIFSRAMLGGGLLIVAGSISLRGVPWIMRRVRRKKSGVRSDEDEQDDKQDGEE